MSDDKRGPSGYVPPPVGEIIGSGTTAGHAPPTSHAEPDASPGRRGPAGALIGLLVIVPAILLVVLAVFWLADNSGGEDTATSEAVTVDPRVPESSTPVPETPDVLSRPGFAALLAAVESATGGTRVFDVTIYPEYAVLELPIDATTQRMERFYWDGETLDGQDSFGQASGPAFNLRRVDVGRMLQLSTKIRGEIDDPESWYVILRAPDDFGGAMYAYATNKFSEGGYVAATLQGKVVRTVTW